MRSSPSSRKSAILAVGAALGVAQTLAQQAEPLSEVKPVKTEKSEKGVTGGRAEKGGKEAKSGKTEKRSKRKEGDDDPLVLPIPKGQPQKGVNAPMYGPDGRLKMNFEIGVATWIDDEHVKLQKTRVQTYAEDGTLELEMELPDSVYNQKTKIISSQTPVRVKRSDFEISGKSMAFNIQTKEGSLGGGVKAIIYDLNGKGSAAGGGSKPAFEFHPEQEKKPVKEEPK